MTKKIKEERVARLRELDHKKRITFYTTQLDTEHIVLAEADSRRPGQYRGFTANYIPVTFSGPSHFANRLVTVRLQHIAGRRVFGIVKELAETQETRQELIG